MYLNSNLCAPKYSDPYNPRLDQGPKVEFNINSHDMLKAKCGVYVKVSFWWIMKRSQGHDSR